MENRFEYLERIAQSDEVEMIASDIYELQHIVPIFRSGLQQRPWEIEMDFRESKRIWIVRYDKLEDGSDQLIVLKRKFK